MGRVALVTGAARAESAQLFLQHLKDDRLRFCRSHICRQRRKGRCGLYRLTLASRPTNGIRRRITMPVRQA